MVKPDCYKCKYRGTIPYDMHSRCNHPTGLINVKGNPRGIKNGWFTFPFNFDPLWLEECDGFEVNLP
jgi:hypothetical protein